MTRKPAWLGVFGVGILMVAAALFYPSRPEYENPVFEPVFADPSVIRAEDGTFYAYGTEDDWGDGAGPRLIPILRSDNLTDWEYVGDAFHRKPGWKSEGGLWAPHIARHRGRYLLYYSYSVWGDFNPGIGVATADHPEGPFTDHGKLFTSEEIGVPNSIDPMFFVDDGTPYLIWGSFSGIYGIRLSDDGLRTVGEKFQIAGDVFEAPYLVKRRGYYYLLVSLGTCCEGERSSYRVAVGRARSLQGPYLDKEGNDLMVSEGTLVLAGDDEEDKEKRFVGPGHNAVVTDDRGTDWIIYHAIDPTDPRLPGGATRRPMLIDPLKWEGGWPSVEQGIPGTDRKPGPVFER